MQQGPQANRKRKVSMAALRRSNKQITERPADSAQGIADCAIRRDRVHEELGLGCDRYAGADEADSVLGLEAADGTCVGQGL